MSDALSQLNALLKSAKERQQQQQQQQQASSQAAPPQLQQLFAQAQQQAQAAQLPFGAFGASGSETSGAHTPPVIGPPPMLAPPPMLPPPPALPPPPQLQQQLQQLQQLHLLQQLQQFQQLQQMQQFQQIQQLQQRLVAAAAASQQQQPQQQQTASSNSSSPAGSIPWPSQQQQRPPVPPNITTEQELQQFLYATQPPFQLPPPAALAALAADNVSLNLLPPLSQIPLPNRDVLEQDPTQSMLDEFNKLSLLKQPLHDPMISGSGGPSAPPPQALNTSILSTSSLNDSHTNPPDVIFQSDRYYMPGTASLIGDVDKLLMVILRDGKTLIGYLRSIDQYANLLLSSTIERVHVGKKYGDIPRGCYIIRGENVVLIGEVDWNLPSRVQMERVGVEEILELQRQEHKRQQEVEKNKKKALTERCMLPQSDFILDDYY